MTWRFEHRRPGQRAVESVLGEFFTSDGIDSLADAVVRESIQNSLDAQDPQHDHVRIAIHISHTGITDTDDLEQLFGSLRPHASSADERMQHVLDGPCRYMVIEDTNTTGLRGDPDDSYGDDENNEYYHFFLSEGRSSKGGAKRGNWGVGKHTFFLASGVRALFGLTVRDDGTRLLLGQSLLTHHKIGDDYFTPDGWWGQIDNRNGYDATMPFRDRHPGAESNDITHFSKIFGVDRRAASGLSLVIPFIDHQLTIDVVERAVLRNYAIAIAAGDLIIDLTSDQTDGVTFSSDSLSTHLDKSALTDTRREVELARVAADSTAHIMLPASDQRASWNEYTMPPDIKAAILDALETNKPFAVRLPVPVEEKTTGTRTMSHVDIAYVADNSAGSVPTYYRRGIRVSEAAKQVRTTGAQALVDVREDALATMLGLAEGPSHVDWSARTERFKDRFVNGRNTISFVRRAPAEILRHARESKTRDDTRAAAEFFSIEHPDHRPTRRSSKKADTGTTTNDMPDLPPKERLANINPTGTSGVSINWNGAELGVEFTTQAAYDTARGNPFSKWSPNDFDLTNMTTHSRDIEVLAVDSNTLRIVVNGPNPSLTIEGFDPLRDLLVQTVVSS